MGAQGRRPQRGAAVPECVWGCAVSAVGARPLRSVAHGDTALPRGPGRLERQPSLDLAEARGPIDDGLLVAVRGSFLLRPACQVLGRLGFCPQDPTLALEETTVRLYWVTGRHPDVPSTT